MKDAKTRFLYGKIGSSDRLADVLAELLQEEPDYDSIVAEIVGCSMCYYQNGYNSIDDNGADFGDNYSIENN